MEMVQKVFELPITVTEADIDQLGHVNNVVYVRWVQEAAMAHWNVLASEQEKARLTWVVVRHEIDYKRAALLGDQVVARTWVGNADGLAFERHTEMVRAGDHRCWPRRGPCGVRSMPRPCGRWSREKRFGRGFRSAPRRLAPDVF